MTALERLAGLKAYAILNKTTLGAIATACGVSYYHFSLVVKGDRVGSHRVESTIASYLGKPAEYVFSHARRNGGG